MSAVPGRDTRVIFACGKRRRRARNAGRHITASPTQLGTRTTTFLILDFSMFTAKFDGSAVPLEPDSPWVTRTIKSDYASRLQFLPEAANSILRAHESNRKRS